MSHHDERTFVMAKPDAVQRGLVGDIVSRLEERGLKLIGAKFMLIDDELAAEHYDEHVGEDYFEDLREFITAGPVLAMAWQGADATAQVRQMVGATDPQDAAPGTIRGDYGLDIGRNLVHAADHEDPGANERELALFFEEEELHDYERVDEQWLYEEDH